MEVKFLFLTYLTPYKENDRLTGTVIVFRDITEQKKDKDLIKYLAYHDDLTQLPNSRKFNEQLQAATRAAFR